MCAHRLLVDALGLLLFLLVLDGDLVVDRASASPLSSPLRSAQVGVAGDHRRRWSRGVRGAQEQAPHTSSPLPPPPSSSLPAPSPKSSSPSPSPSPATIIATKKVKSPPKSAAYNDGGSADADFLPACVAELNRRASEEEGTLTSAEYGAFVLGYCSQSPTRRGDACNFNPEDGAGGGGGGPSPRMFTALPVQLQLAFAQPSCSGSSSASEYGRLQCLAALLEKGDGVLSYDGEVEELCQATSTLLVATRMIVPSPSSFSTTIPVVAPPSLVPTAPAQAPALVPLATESSSGGEGEGALGATTTTDAALARPTGAPSPSGGSIHYVPPTSKNPQSVDSAATPPPPQLGVRQSAGPVAAAVLIGASLGGLLVAALWLRHRVQFDRTKERSRRRNGYTGDDEGGRLAAGDSPIPSEDSSEIFLVEPPPKPPKSNRASDRRSKKRGWVTPEHRESGEDTKTPIENCKDVESDATDASRIPIAPEVPSHHAERLAPSPLEHGCVHSHGPSHLELDRGEAAWGHLQLPPVSALSDPRDSRNMMRVSEGEGPTQQAPRAQNPLPHLHQWRPIHSRASRAAGAAAAAAYGRDGTAQPEAVVESPSSGESVPSPTAAAPAEEDDDGAVSSSVLKRVRQIEKDLIMSPQNSIPRQSTLLHGRARGVSSLIPPMLATAQHLGCDATDSMEAPMIELQPVPVLSDGGVGDHFVLDPVESLEVTSDVSDVDSAGESDEGGDDDWTEETVSVEHAEMEIGEILEDMHASDDASLEEEVIVEEFVPIAIEGTPRHRVQEAWPQRRIEEMRKLPPSPLFIPPLVSNLNGAESEEPIGALNNGTGTAMKRSVKEMIAAYDKSPSAINATILEGPTKSKHVAEKTSRDWISQKMKPSAVGRSLIGD